MTLTTLAVFLVGFVTGSIVSVSTLWFLGELIKNAEKKGREGRTP